MAVRVLTHLLGVSGLIALMRLHTQRLMTAQARFNQAAILVGAACGLFALHTLDIWGYGALYWILKAVPTFEEALYFSTVTYATIEFGDLIRRAPGASSAPSKV